MRSPTVRSMGVAKLLTGLEAERAADGADGADGSAPSPSNAEAEQLGLRKPAIQGPRRECSWRM